MKFLLPRLICASPLRSPTRAEEITLAQILKSAACRTGHFGRDSKTGSSSSDHPVGHHKWEILPIVPA
jgi:hypothetical protein